MFLEQTHEECMDKEESCLHLTLKWFRRKFTHTQKKTNKTNVVKCQYVGKLGEVYIGTLSTILAAFLQGLKLYQNKNVKRRKQGENLTNISKTGKLLKPLNMLQEQYDSHQEGKFFAQENYLYASWCQICISHGRLWKKMVQQRYSWITLHNEAKEILLTSDKLGVGLKNKEKSAIGKEKTQEISNWDSHQEIYREGSS